MKLLLLMLISVSGAPAQPHTIAGVVQNPSGHPQKRVRVAIAPESDREKQTALVTGEDGRFRFDGLRAGKFRLTAEPPTGGIQAFGQRTLATGMATAVVTGADQRTDNLIFRLIAPCVIRGRVVDADGEPAEGVLVQLFVSALLRGKRSVFYIRYRYTDDRGEYRFGGIGDGSYYVAVAGRPWYSKEAPLDTGLARTGYSTTYYPGTREVSSAGLLTLKPGQEAVADFTLSPIPGANLSATVQDATGQVRLDLTFEGVGAARTFADVATAYGARPVIIRGVEPGRYTIRARTMQGKTLFGSAKVHVGNGDTSVIVTMNDPPVVTGKLWIEDSRLVPEGTYVELENEVEGIHTRRTVAADGAFRFEAMPPGKYRLLVVTPAKFVHLRSITVDGTAVAEEMIEISKDARLELLGLLSGGSVAGEVVRDGHPVEGVLALLAPRKESANPLDYRAFQTDSDGTFEWDGVPPGEYVLIVREDWADFEYANPAAVRPIVQSGRPIRVDGTASGRIRVELK
jgi:hypothetical protein